MPQVTIGLSLHRPEMTPLISDHMRRHEAIFLEEPPDVGFEPMLAGRLAVDDYLMQLDVEYPTLADCRRLFPLVRRAKSSDAREIVAEYLAEFGPQLEPAFQPEKAGRTTGNESTAI